MTGIQVLQMNELQTKKMLCDGASYKQIGEIFGVSKEVVAYFAKLNNLSRGSIKNSKEDVARKIREKTNGQLEYVSGYTKKESVIKVRCSICGETFERTYHHLTTHPNDCPICKENERKDKEQRQIRERAVTEQRKLAQKFSRHQLIGMRVCTECGALFIPKASNYVRCSPECTRKAMNRSADARLNTDNVIDKDITLTKLYKRDDGICKICGGVCDWNDCEVRENGTVVAGDWYPSIDHIKPISKGGLHSWGNVRLAHRGCNTKFYWGNQRFAPLP